MHHRESASGEHQLQDAGIDILGINLIHAWSEFKSKGNYEWIRPCRALITVGFSSSCDPVLLAACISEDKHIHVS